MVAENQYAQARQTFLRFKAGLEDDHDILRELLAAFEILLNERSTTYHENRFIVGGAVEHMVAAAMRCIGLNDAEVVGFDEDRVDIRVQGLGFSLKTAFTSSRQIALINTQGEGEPRWTAPTILVLATGRSRGISYADPELLPGVVQRAEGQLVLPRNPLNRMLREQPEYLLSCEIPVNPGAPEDELQTPMALSQSVATDILFRTEQGQSLFSEDSLQEFLRRTAGDARVFPRLSDCMEIEDGDP